MSGAMVQSPPPTRPIGKKARGKRRSRGDGNKRQGNPASDMSCDEGRGNESTRAKDSLAYDVFSDALSEEKLYR